MKHLRICAMAVLSLAVLAVLLALATTAQAAPLARRHQYIASVILKQGTGEARVTISVVDLGPSRKYPAKMFQRGAIVRDDIGRQVGIKGNAKLLYQGRTFQIFQLTDARLVRRGKIVRVAHLVVGVFSGDDWAHWYDDGYVCASPQMQLKECLEMWR